MTIFTWLLLGHLVADWLLQNDWMAVGKHNGLNSIPGITHYAVYTIVILGFFAIAMPTCIRFAPMLGISSFVFISHWLIDGADLARKWMRCFGQRDQLMVRIVIDQTFHLLVLGAIAAACLGGPLEVVW